MVRKSILICMYVSKWVNLSTYIYIRVDIYIYVPLSIDIHISYIAYSN